MAKDETKKVEGKKEGENFTAGTGFFKQFPMFPKQIILLHFQNTRNCLKKTAPAMDKC